MSIFCYVYCTLLRTMDSSDIFSYKTLLHLQNMELKRSLNNHRTDKKKLPPIFYPEISQPSSQQPPKRAPILR
jgi:hypothetical protein